MFIIEFKSTALQAFTHGLIKGLGAPVTLYHQEAAPPLPPAYYIDASKAYAVDGLAADWARINNDMDKVIKNNVPAEIQQRYEQPRKKTDANRR